jgi:uncharacterized protein (DUF58 family)
MRWYEAFEWRFPGFSLRASKAFWWFLLWVAVLGLAALNTGNNALYMLLALSLGAFVASGVLSRHTLAHLRGDLRLPAEIWAAAACPFSLRLRNTSPWLPAWGVLCRLEGLPGAAVAPAIPPGGEVSVSLVSKFPRRGLWPKPALIVEVRLPLGFFVKALKLPQEGEVLVYPPLVPAGVPRFVGVGEQEVEAGRGRSQREGEVELLREFRAGDDLRHVHWKQTARQQRLIVMERWERKRPRRYLFLDPRVANPSDPKTLQRFDDLVAEVASVARKLLQKGEAVGLVVGARVIPPAWGPEHLRRLLRELALVQPVGLKAAVALPSRGPQAIYRLAGP